MLLDQLIEHIRQSGPYVLANPEDADYFRALHKKIPPPKAIQPELITPPPISPLPIRIEPTPPPSQLSPPIQTAPKPKQIVPESAPEPKPFTDLSSIRHILSVVAPELAIIPEIPSDALAYKISERWKTKNQSAPISILTFQEPAEQKALLEQIAIALDVSFGPAKIVHAETIEKEKQWDAFLSVDGLKTIIVCDYTLWQLNHLMHFYKETPAQGIRVLGQVPLFLLPDLALYLKDPLLKRSLWKALCQKCS